MKKFLLTALLVSVSIPNSSLTPGKINPNLTKKVICAKEFSTENYRTVKDSQKKKIYSEYGIPYKDHSLYEVDHLISLELGGSNDNVNLWPQPYPEARWKDTIENYLHRAVCKDEMNLKEAQRAVVSDWYKIYQGRKNK
jgi:hypothetical protein